MRLSCAFEAPAVVGDVTVIDFRDGYEAARIGWREIAVGGSGTTLLTDGLARTSPSLRLTAYPDSLASSPDVREATFEVRAGGPELEPFSVPGTLPVGPIDVAAGAPTAITGEPRPALGPRAPATAPTAVPAGGGATILALPAGAEAVPDLLRAAPVDPLLALAALAVAAALGAGHALTPGHGKTLMAAYLVGTRGGRRHAVGLGLAVAVSHTAGILVLAMIVVAAERALPVDVVVRAAPIVAAVSIVIVGGWMLLGELRRRLAARREHAHAHAHRLEHDHGHDHDLPHAPDPLEHSHGGVRHSHAPAGGTRVTWRSLFLLGLAGGLIPSASALLLLLGTIAAGRPAWGVVLVAAFGVGMAGVMTGIGLALVFARERVERSSLRLPVGRLASAMPLATGSLVLVLGVVLTTQALAAARLG
jgi:nickel/cobalt exporter